MRKQQSTSTKRICSWQYRSWKDTPAVLSPGKLRRSQILPGVVGQWSKNHTSFKTAVIQCNTGNYVPIVVPGLSTGPPSSTLNIGTAGPNNRRFYARSSTTRSPSTRSRARRDLLHGSTETKNKNRNQDIDATLGRRSHDLPEWLEFFTDKLVGDEGSASRDALARFSREPLHQESSRKVVSGNQGVFINTLPEGPKLQSMRKITNNDKRSLQQTPW